MTDSPTETDEQRYARDSDLAKSLRRFDRSLGTAEQVALFALLIVVVATSLVGYAYSKISGKPLEHGGEMIRYGVFALAMLGGAFAAHNQRLLSLDLLSRFLAPRGRAFLRIALGLFTIAMALVGLWIGWKVRATVTMEKSGGIPISLPALFIPIGMALIAVHTLLQGLIDADYLRRGELPPEPEQGAV